MLPAPALRSPFVVRQFTSARTPVFMVAANVCWVFVSRFGIAGLTWKSELPAPSTMPPHPATSKANGSKNTAIGRGILIMAARQDFSAMAQEFSCLARNSRKARDMESSDSTPDSEERSLLHATCLAKPLCCNLSAIFDGRLTHYSETVKPEHAGQEPKIGPYPAPIR